jgi:16S rRNA (adenine1518-N6/adenine1519-N6)-dimethyltransferase
MSLEETNQLIQTYRISPNKFMGQNFMVDTSLYPKLTNYALLQASDIVLDVGAGFGFLTRFLADRCKKVIAVEKDPQIANVLQEQIKHKTNVTVVKGDILKSALPAFNKTISIPPYYLSSHLIIWLLDQKIDCAVLIMQKEFSNRLVAPVGSEAYGWLTVVTCQNAEVDLLDEVPRSMFHPQPEVDSVILRLMPLNIPSFEVNDQEIFRQMVKWLFTQRNKKLGKALSPFLRNALKKNKQESEKLALSLSLNERRVRTLTPKEFGAIADVLRS